MGQDTERFAACRREPFSAVIGDVMDAMGYTRQIPAARIAGHEPEVAAEDRQRKKAGGPEMKGMR